MSTRLQRVSIGAAAALGGLLAGLKPLREADLYWHLSLGRAVLRARDRVVPEPTAMLGFGEVRVVHEWLWDVLSFALWSVGGALATTAMVAALGALLGALLWGVALGRGAARSLPAACLCAALALAPALSRVRERPETLALVILPALLLALRRWSASRGLVWGAAVVALTAVWAQVHGTAPLALGVVGVAVAPDLLGARDRRSALLLLAVAAATFTGSAGLGVLTFLGAHARGDAVAHIDDMKRLTWDTFDPTEGVGVPSFVALLALGLGGMIASGGCWPRRFGWAALGVALAVTASRGVALGVILALPLAGAGAEAVRSWAERRWSRPRVVSVFALAALAIVLRGAAWFAARQGPIGELGINPLAYPLAAAPTLRALPAGSPVYSSFLAGGPLGFALDGHARVFIDSRVPMHFDDLHFAVSRDLSAGAGPAAAFRRYGFAAAVVERDAPLCASLDGDRAWRPVLLAGHWSVFVRAELAGAEPLQALAPCGASWTRGACTEAVAREVAAQRSRLDRSAAAALEAEVALACGGAVSTRTAQSLPDPPRRGVSAVWQRTLRARVAARRGDLDEALRWARPLCEEGRLQVLPELAPRLQRARRMPELASLLGAAVRSFDDGAPADLRADLAAVLALQGDAEGARFHGVRAAAAGNRRVGSVLRWVARHHPEAAARSDAAAWARSVDPERR